MSKHKQRLEDFKPPERLIDERGPTAQRLAKVPYEIGDTGTLTVRQSPIQRAVARGTLTGRQGRAADKFYLHWFRANLAGTVGSSDPLKIFGNNTDISRLCTTEMAEFHYNRVRQALGAIAEKMDKAGFRKDHAVKLMGWIVCEEMAFADAGQKIGFSGKAAEIMARTYMRANMNILIEEWGL